MGAALQRSSMPDIPAWRGILLSIVGVALVDGTLWVGWPERLAALPPAFWLLARGFSQRQTVLILYVVSLGLSVVATLLYLKGI